MTVPPFPPFMPKALRARPRDRRGYPVPFIVLTDRMGKVHFTVNDGARVVQCKTKNLCGLCGRRHSSEGVWFVGGMRCFTDPMGRFLDPPMHEDCARYALSVCPYLAAPRYSKRIDAQTVDPAALDPRMDIVTAEQMSDDRPDRFGLGHALEWRMHPMGEHPHHVLFEAEGWISVECWRFGKQLA